MMKNILKSLFVAVALVFGVNAFAADPDLTGYTLVKSFTTGGAVDVATGDQISITAYETGNKKQQALYAATAPEEAAGWIAFQAVKGSGSKGWWNREGKGLYCYNANRSAAIYGESLTLGSVVVFKCASTATSAITLTNANNEPDGTFTYQLSEDGKTYYCTITAETNAYVGFCGAKSGTYISSIEVYQPNAPVTQATYTVKYVNEEGAELKEAVSYNGIAGNSISLTDADKANITVGEDVYVYTSDDSEGKTIAADGSTVITVSFHKAANMTYTVNELCGENVARQTTGSSYETATVSVPYRRYNVVDGTLWEKGASNKEYNHKFTLTKEGQVVAVSYTQTTITDVVFLSEGEDLEGATKCTNSNTGIRSSNSSSAYAADGDVMITMLPAGQYKMTAVICDVSKNGGQSMSFKIGDKDLVTITTEAVNWHQGTHEFTVYGQQPIYLAQGGSANLGLDFVYFQKTGDVAPMEVANIGVLKDVPEGAEVKLALTDAVVNLWSGDYTTQSMASYIEDATGAIKFDTGLSNMEWMRDSIAMNGYIYASYGKDYDGIPQLSVSDSTGASKVDTVAAVPASKVMTVADASNETALSRYVKFEKVEFIKKVVDDWGTTECYLVQGTDTIMFFDKFSRFGWNAMPDFKSFDEVQGFISMYDGKFEFYPYGEYKANYTPAVVAENIAAAKAVESGTNVNLTLKDAKITAYVSSKWGGATAYIEDASGAIQIAGDVLSQFGVENDSTILNGNIYVKYVNEWGSIQLSAGDSIAFSKVEAKEGAVSPTTMAVKDIKAETNVARYVEIAFPSFKYDAENYYYYAAQNGDTIMVVDNFGWMSSNFEMDDEYNLILPDSVSSIRGIVMWDDWNGYSIVPTGIDEFVAPQDIVVNVTEGDIAAAVEAAKAEVAKVGKITINLTEGAAYTIANSIVAPASLVINGNGATVDATGLGANMITTDAAQPAEWVTIDSIAVKDVTVKGLGKALYYSAIKNQNIQNFVVDNSVVEIVKDVTVFDFTKGSVAMNFTVKNSTLYAPTATTKSIYSSQSAQKGSEAGATADAPQTFTFENTTLYNLTHTKNFFTHRQNSQKWLKYVIKNNVIVNSGKANFVTSINGGGDSANPIYDVTTNSVGTLADGVYTDLSASQTVQSNVMGTLVTTNPDFKDAANGDFTVGAGSDQAKEKIGDPRWLVEYDNTATAIEGVNATIMNNGDIYTINGVKVRNAGDSLKGLAKGLYIINGKKLIVK